jgi:hypothetical protein
LLLVAVITSAPAFLFFDPAPFWPGENHVAREPRAIYLLFSDDVAYVASSRTWAHAASNLFVPHNTHIVPAWRILTWAVTAWAGNLERLPDVLAVVSYSIVVAVMLLTGRLVARETGRTDLGLAAMILVGTTSQMLTPALWYSAGQTLWAGFGILSALWYVQTYRRGGRIMALVLAMIAAVVAGWFWTIGHLAGPVAAVYLWADGRRRCRIAAAAPLAASVIAVALSLAISASKLNSKTSFHGRTVREAFSPIQGLLHSAQAIPENLVFGNLGLATETTAAQGALLTVGLFTLWLSRLWLRRRHQAHDDEQTGVASLKRWPFSPLECAGAALVVGSYVVEWTFRGYMDYRYLRTLNVHFIVPWYHAIPQIGAVLWLAGWWSDSRPATMPFPAATKSKTITRWRCAGVGVLVVTMLLLHRPRVDFLIRESVPPLLPKEQRLWPILSLQMMRANVLLLAKADWQRTVLRRLDRAQSLANRLGIGRQELRAAFGHHYLSANENLLQPEAYDLYDTVALLDIPERGHAAIPASAFRELSELFAELKEPRPEWLDPDDTWPPPIKPIGEK